MLDCHILLVFKVLAIPPLGLLAYWLGIRWGLRNSRWWGAPCFIIGGVFGAAGLITLLSLIIADL